MRKMELPHYYASLKVQYVLYLRAKESKPSLRKRSAWSGPTHWCLLRASNKIHRLDSTVKRFSYNCMVCLLSKMLLLIHCLFLFQLIVEFVWSRACCVVLGVLSSPFYPGWEEGSDCLAFIVFLMSCGY